MTDFNRNNPQIAEVLLRLQNLHRENIDLGLDRTFKLLEKMGNPQNNLPPVIHIAGTNGKGSTLSFIQGILESAGLTVHRYTSPELVKFNERYIVSGNEISDEDLLRYLLDVEKINDGDPITFFEITTAVCFKMFADNPADVVLLETGLGGRLDSTNVVPNTAVNVLTNISLDHEAFLGDTVEKIAYEKSCIIRAGANVVIAPQTSPTIDNVIMDKCDEMGAKIISHKLHWNYEKTADGLTLKTDSGMYKLPKPALVGNHQYDNSATAVMACLQLSRFGIEVSEDDFINGLKNAVHRGRFEKISLKNIDKQVYMDGGHNPSAGIAIADNLKSNGVEKINVICGMLSGKDVANFIKPIKPYIDQIYTLRVADNPFSTAPAMTANELAEAFTKLGLNATPCDGLDMALDLANNHSNEIVACIGSLHLVGDLIDYMD